MASTTPATRNLNAEVRAVENGHRAFADGPSIVVVSDTYHDKRYRVTPHAHAVGEPISFVCRPEGDRVGDNDHDTTSAPAGVTPCMHAALAARRMERDGRARLDDGRWVNLTPPAPAVGDPFAGLPS